MKKWIVIGCALLLGIGVLIFFIIVPNQQSKQLEDTSIMRIAIYPTGTSEESYYFTLNQAGVLKGAVGSRISDNIMQSNFLKTETTSSEKQLNDMDLQALTDMAKKLEIKGGAEKQSATDSWVVALLYNGKVYEMDYWHNDDFQEFMNLINKIIELSPVPVDLHGWS